MDTADKPQSVLRIVIDNMIYPITLEVIHKVCFRCFCRNVVFRPPRSTSLLEAVYYCRRSSVVCQSVCRSQLRALQQWLEWTDQDAIWVVDSDGHKEPCIRCEADYFEGEKGPSQDVSCGRYI